MNKIITPTGGSAVTPKTTPKQKRVIRLWRLGHINEKNPECSIYPTQEAIERLCKMLLENKDSDTLDIVWGPELDLKVFETEGDVEDIIIQDKGLYGSGERDYSEKQWDV